VPKELSKPNSEFETTIEASEELLADVEATRRESMTPEYSEEPSESDQGEEMEETSEEEAQPSPFQPVAGVQGKYPPGWRKRQERKGSLDDHWHRKL
jgi:hypothetical protein